MPYVSTRAGRVFLTDEGSGMPVVLLHATLHDHHDFDTVAPALAEQFRVIALDWPGHGQSDPAGSAATATLFADVLEDVVNELELPPAAFIGNSVGGFAAARLAITHPDQVARLVLVNTGGFTRQTVLTRAFCRTIGMPWVTRMLLPRMIPAYMKAQSDNDNAVLQRAVARARTPEGVAVAASLWRSFAEPDYDLRGEADRITAPVLLVWGSRDVVLPLREGRSARAALPGSQLEVLPTGHVVFSSDPTGFLAHAVEFIK